MMMIGDHEYFARRARQEDDAARSATCIEGRICHQKLADAYRRRCDDIFAATNPNASAKPAGHPTKCPTCRRVWLDRGELDKIIERATLDIAPPPPPRLGGARQEPYPGPWRYSDDYDRDYRHASYRKRKKSAISELFD